MSISSLNLEAMDLRMPQSCESSRTNSNLMTTKKLYPYPKSYRDCLLPANHPWAKQAGTEMLQLNKALVERNIPKYFDILANKWPFFALTRKDLPFVIKIHCTSEADLCVKRVINAARYQKFIKEENLDRLQIPAKFLVARNEKTDEITDQFYVVLAEKVNIANDNAQNAIDLHNQKIISLSENALKKFLLESENSPSKIWNSINPEIRKKQMAQAAFMISELAITDGHHENIVLLTNGCFSVIDTDEPAGFLVNNLNDEDGSLRDEEIGFAKMGLCKFLLNDFTKIKYDVDSHSQLYQKSIKNLDKELFKNHLTRKCQFILTANQFPSSPRVEKARRENLAKRLFSLMISYQA